MNEYRLTTEEIKIAASYLRVGDRVLLSGDVYTSRDAAHKRIFEDMKHAVPLPYPLSGAVIYYAGPTPTPKSLPIGSCGPTTSKRMDPYTPRLYDAGVIATIGKGERNQDVMDAIIRNRAVYFCALGGAGALAAMCITNCTVIAYEDLGCESVKRLTFHDFPLTVGIDSSGGNIFKHK